MRALHFGLAAVLIVSVAVPGCSPPSAAKAVLSDIRLGKPYLGTFRRVPEAMRYEFSPTSVDISYLMQSDEYVFSSVGRTVAVHLVSPEGTDQSWLAGPWGVIDDEARETLQALGARLRTVQNRWGSTSTLVSRADAERFAQCRPSTWCAALDDAPVEFRGNSVQVSFAGCGPRSVCAVFGGNTVPETFSIESGGFVLRSQVSGAVLQAARD